jgi:pseudaminic acid synthase
MTKKIRIGNHLVGEGEPALIVAEISCNHLQKKDIALKIIEEAKAAGADAVKFQTLTPDTITLNVDNEYFRIKGTAWSGRTLHDLYQEAYTPWEWFPELKDRTEQEGMVFFSTPFDKTAVDFLENLGTHTYKVASFEVNHIPLLKYIATKKKPVIFSTGLATEPDIELAINTIRGQGNDDIIVLKCTSTYPAPVNEMNLLMIPEIRKRFGVLVGLSDHSLSIVPPIVSVALGACIIEKHIITNLKSGPDAGFSLDPQEFRHMVNVVRDAEASIGKVDFELTENAREHRVFMRSIFVAEDMKKGEQFTEKNVRVVRPGQGLHPKYYEALHGRHAKKDIKRGTPLDWSLIEEDEQA